MATLNHSAQKCTTKRTIPIANPLAHVRRPDAKFAREDGEGGSRRDIR